MGTTVEELKRLYTKLGGKDKQVATFNQPGEVINAINELDIGGGGMPDVGPEDVGKVATVNDEGEWDAETPAAVPTVTPNPEGEATETLNKIGIDATIYDFPKELPAVTAEDNGDVLSVVAGEWTKSAPSGGVKYYTATVLSGSDHRVKLDNNVQYQTLVDFYFSGGMPVIVTTTKDYRMHLFPQKRYGNDITFLGIFNDDASGSTWKIMQVMLRSASIGDNQRGSTIYTITTSRE